MIVRSHIDGRDVEYVTTLKPHCSEYCVFKSKIWKVISTTGSGNNVVRELERPKAKEKVTIRSEQIKNVYLLIKPTGFIDI